MQMVGPAGAHSAKTQTSNIEANLKPTRPKTQTVRMLIPHDPLPAQNLNLNLAKCKLGFSVHPGDDLAFFLLRCHLGATTSIEVLPYLVREFCSLPLLFMTLFRKCRSVKARSFCEFQSGAIPWSQKTMPCVATATMD